MKKNIITAFCLLISALTIGQVKPISYADGTTKLSGFAISPEKISKNAPGVLILPAWMGIDQLSKDSAKKLADLGYFTFVADIYGEGKYPKDYSEAGAKAGYYKKNYLEYHKRINLALQQLIKSGANPDNIVVMGYCFGGTGALEVARGDFNVKGVVSFHGGLSKDISRGIKPIKTKVLVCHGADDPYESPEEIVAFQKEMRDTKADWQMIYYANAVHSFTNPEAGNDNSKGAAYNEVAAKRSWEHLLIFLKEVLK